MPFQRKLGVALRDMSESLGVQGTIATIREMLQKKEITPEDFSLQELWEAFERDEQGYVKPITEAVSSDLFPKITGELISSKVISAYQQVMIVGDKLAPTIKSKLKVGTYAGFTAATTPDEIPEGTKYNTSEIEEKYATIEHKKYGKLIEVTEEMIYFDQTNQVIARANLIGQKAAYWKEKLIVEGIQDINSNVYKPAAVATAFYRTAASGDRKINSVASTPFGEAGLLSAKNTMDLMTDEEGDYIMLLMGALQGLFPVELEVRVRQMLQSTLVPEGTENAVNTWKNWFTPLFSPFVSNQSTTTWYIGNFGMDFVWSEVWPLQTFTMKPGNESEFRRDVKHISKVRFHGGVGAIDDKHSFKFEA